MVGAAVGVAAAVAVVVGVVVGVRVVVGVAVAVAVAVGVVVGVAVVVAVAVGVVVAVTVGVVTPRRKPRRAELGLSLEEYDALLAAQGGGCAICGNPPKTRRLDVDHDHRTGKVRGLLCHRCNRALPSWIEAHWLGAAARYLSPDVLGCPVCGG